jgi:hypothetical protein
LGRRYQDLLGRVNQIVAAQAGKSLFLVAGRALELASPHQVAAHWFSDTTHSDTTHSDTTHSDTTHSDTTHSDTTEPGDEGVGCGAGR